MSKRVLNDSQLELLDRLMRAGGAATSADLGGYVSGCAQRAREKCRIEGLVTYDRPGKVGGRWHITDEGRAVIAGNDIVDRLRYAAVRAEPAIEILLLQAAEVISTYRMDTEHNERIIRSLSDHITSDSGPKEFWTRGLS